MRSLASLFTLVITILYVPLSNALPFIVFHGIANQCSHSELQHFTGNLSVWSASKGYCVEIGNGEKDSWFMPLENQSRIACDKVKQMKELSDGYNIVAISQGNMVARGLIQFCEGGPKVKNYVSLGGPQAGIAAIPDCTGIFCNIVDGLVKAGIYTDFVQKHLAPSGFLKLPNKFEGYLKKCSYLPKLNNEKPEERNATYKERFSSLENLVLIMSENDTVLVPKETSWFGFYPDGKFSPVLSALQTKLYSEDWIGLKTLNEAGKVKFVKVAGGHVDISDDDMKEHIVPYLRDT